MRFGWKVAIGLIGIGLLPVIGQSVAMVMTALGGCRPAGGALSGCVLGGRDWGGLVAGLTVLGRMFFLTAPLALAGFVLAIALALGALIRRARS